MAGAEAQQRLLFSLMYGWRRRGTSLLQIGEGCWLDPDRLWDDGFDVTVAAVDRKLPQYSRKQTAKCEYIHSAADSVPFDEGHFDYVIVNHQLIGHAAQQQENILDEALRVASRGVIILEANRFSPGCGLSANTNCQPASGADNMQNMRGIWPWKLASLLRRHCHGSKMTWLSSLLFERCPSSGMLRALLKPACTACFSVPVGKLIGVRIEWESMPVTPIGLLARARASLCMPAKAQESVYGRKAE